MSEGGVQPAKSFCSAHQDVSTSTTASSGLLPLSESDFYEQVRSGAARRVLAGAGSEKAVDAAIREVKHSYFVIPECGGRAA